MNKETGGEAARPLVADLPNGRFYDPPLSEDEADDIEDIMLGYLTLEVSVPMSEFMVMLKARLGTDDMLPTRIDWARLRYHLKAKVLTYLLSLTFPDFGAEEEILVRPGPLALERPRDSDLYGAPSEGDDWTAMYAETNEEKGDHKDGSPDHDQGNSDDTA